MLYLILNVYLIIFFLHILSFFVAFIIISILLVINIILLYQLRTRRHTTVLCGKFDCNRDRRQPEGNNIMLYGVPTSLYIRHSK